MAIPMEHFGKALRLCGVMPSEKLLQTITERIEKQLPVITPPPSDDEEEEEEDEVVYTDEEKEIAAELATGALRPSMYSASSAATMPIAKKATRK